MAFPMAPMPTVGVFAERCTKEFGCNHEFVEGQVNGKVHIYRYLSRVHQGKAYAVIIDDRDDLTLNPSTLWHYCRRLKLDPGDFGLALE